MDDTIERERVPVGAPPLLAKPTRTPAQLENVKKARAKKQELDDSRIQEKERLKAEARFDKLLELFEKVRVEEPVLKPVPEEPVLKKKPRAVVKKPPPTPVESEEEEEPQAIQKAKPKAQAVVTGKTINLRFC
jgi:hypothetical protein